MKKPVETEVKIPIMSLARARTLLRHHGFQVKIPRLLEQNSVFDDRFASLREQGLLLRLRKVGKRVVCTYKGPSLPGRHKSREEREFEASDFDACREVFRGIGFRETFYYEKFRTEFAREGDSGHVTLDETPIGNYLELEGPARWINRSTKDLGFTSKDWITESYVGLYFGRIGSAGWDPAGMRFSDSKGRRAGVAPVSGR